MPPSPSASGPSLYRRASFLLEKLGTRIAAPRITIVDDALIPGALGSRPFDGEGLATRKTTIVQEGDFIVCAPCRKKYPIREGIPVMLVSEAVDLE